MKSIFNFVKTTVIGGIIFLIPVIVIITVVVKAIQLVSRLSEALANFMPADTLFGLTMVNIINLLVIAIVCFLAGLIAQKTMLSRAIRKAETKYLWLVPGYTFIRGMFDSFGEELSTDAMKPVKVGSEDSYSIGFEVDETKDGKLVVFMPGAPNPKSGSISIVSKDKVDYLPISTAAAFKIFFSLGKGTSELLKKV